MSSKRVSFQTQRHRQVGSERMEKYISSKKVTSLLNDAHKISHAPGSMTERVICQEPGSDLPADLGISREAGSNCNLPQRQLSFFIYSFLKICWLCWFLIATQALSLVAVNGGYSILAVYGVSHCWWLLLFQSLGSSGVRRLQ